MNKPILKKKRQKRRRRKAKISQHPKFRILKKLTKMRTKIMLRKMIKK